MNEVTALSKVIRRTVPAESAMLRSINVVVTNAPSTFKVNGCGARMSPA